MAYQFLDVLKSTDNHNNWDEVTSLLTSYSKDQNEMVNSISQSLLHINNYKSKSKKLISRNDKEKSLNYIKLICKLKHLLYSEVCRSGLNCLELSSDCFRIIIVLNDVRSLPNDCIFKQILFEYNKEKPVSCPELLKSLADGYYDQLLVHIYELQMLYSVGHDKQEQLKAFLCLQSLEEDVNKLSKCLINTTNYQSLGNGASNGMGGVSESFSSIPQPNNLIGIVKTRSGGIPAQFVFYCPMQVKSDFDSLSQTASCAPDRFKITLQLMSHHEKNLLPFIPLVNLQKDINGNCSPSSVIADALKCVSLAAKFVLRLSQPLVMCDSSIASILSITGLDVVTTGIRMNYIDLILSQNGSSLINIDQFFNVLPNDNQLIFLISETSANISAQTVTSIPFLLPNQIPRIISILKKQAVINCLMESFLLGELKSTFIQDVNNAQIVHVTIISLDYLIFSYTRPNGSLIKFSVSFNDLSQVSVNFLSKDKMMDQYGITPSKFQNIIYKYNNLTMAIFWILYKSGDIFILEGFQDDNQLNTNRIPGLLECCDQQMMNSTQQYLIDDNQFVDQCITIAKSNLSIKSLHNRDVLPKITIEPKLELLTKTTPIQINNNNSNIGLVGLSQHENNPNNMIGGKSKPPPPPALSTQSVAQTLLNNGADYHQTGGNMIMHNSCQIMEPPIGNHQSATISTSHASSSSSSSSSSLSSSVNNNTNTVLVSPVPPLQQPQSSQQHHKCESMAAPFGNYGSKHMNLDQMLSSDFAMPFASETPSSINNLSHQPLHYNEHSSHNAASMNYYNNHFNMMSHKKESNPKNSRMYDTQSSVLVNLLNCNENTGPNNSCNFMNRQIPKNMTNPSQMSDQFESPMMHPHLSRYPQIPRLRMPHPNPHKSTGASGTSVSVGGAGGNTGLSSNSVSQRPTMSTISQSPPAKTDVMMMPYPQDTGNGRASMSRKPRKRKLSTLEMNQRLPKKPLMQPPTMRQPSSAIHHEMMHNSLQSIDHPMSTHHGNSSGQQQHQHHQQQQHQQQQQQSSSVVSSNFSSPTTMDQSIYDFDDNIDCGRSRIMSSAGGIGSSTGLGGGVGGGGGGCGTSIGAGMGIIGGNNMGAMTSQSNNFNNPSANRKFSNTPSKKPLKVKISRKAISQNTMTAGTAASVGAQDVGKTITSGTGMGSMPTATYLSSSDQSDSNRIRDKLHKSSGSSNSHSNNHNIPGLLSSVRSTAIMNAIDSPLTCSSLSSMQTSPHGSVSVACSGMSMENMGGAGGDPSLMKKRRKRRLKSELEDTLESLKKKEKLEMRKQNRKKKEQLLLGGVGGNQSSSSLSNIGMGSVNSGSLDLMSSSCSNTTDLNIKAPLPIKLSLNAKTGSVSNTGGGGASGSGSSLSSSSTNNMSSNRNSKMSMPMMSQSTSASAANSWINQAGASSLGSSTIGGGSNSGGVGIGSGGSANNTSGLMKQQHQSMKNSESMKQHHHHHHQTSLVAKPLLKNYKIPKKKSSDPPPCPVPVAVSISDSLKNNNNIAHSSSSSASSSNLSFSKSLSNQISTPQISTGSSGNNNGSGTELTKTTIKENAGLCNSGTGTSGTVGAGSTISGGGSDGLKYDSDLLSVTTTMSANVLDRPKTPIMLHPDAAVTLSCQSQITTSSYESDNNNAKNIHDIVDKLRARGTMANTSSGTAINSGCTSGNSASMNESISVNSTNNSSQNCGGIGGGGNNSSAIANAISDYASTKPPPPPPLLPGTTVSSQNGENNNNNNNNASENIFEKFSSSKNNGKSDHRQFTNSRFADSSCMNVQRYPSYSRPPAGFPAPKLRPPMGGPMPYGAPRQPYMNNTNLYRMDSGVPPPNRNFSACNVPNPIPYGQKKNPNNNSFVNNNNNKKKDF